MANKRLQELRGSRGQSKKDKPGSTKKSERTAAKVFHGWDLPWSQDENDIVSWMNREKNGDNKRKPHPNEDLPEETFRHDFILCRTVENPMEFERESLHERYRKNCQVGAISTERSSSNWKKLKEKVMAEGSNAATRLRFPRSCKSAELPTTPKVSTLQQAGLGWPESENGTPVGLSRSHSVIDDSRLKACGLTLPPDEKTLRLLELAERFTSKREAGSRRPRVQQAGEAALDEVADEGYDSKVSSNDNEQEDDTEGSKVAQHDGSSVYTNLDSLVQGNLDTHDAASTHIEEDDDDDNGEEDDDETSSLRHTHRFHRTTNLAAQNLARKLLAGAASSSTSQKDSIAKLIYSRRDLNVYERSPSRRKDTSFRYAGKEQSRLMETSLSNITPGYLNMHQLATLTSVSPNPGGQIPVENLNQLQTLLVKYPAAQRQHSTTPHHHPHNHNNHHHHHHHQYHPHHQPYDQFHKPNQTSNTFDSNIDNNAIPNIINNLSDKQQQQQKHHHHQHQQHHHQQHHQKHHQQHHQQQLIHHTPNNTRPESMDQKHLALRPISLQDSNQPSPVNSHNLVDNLKITLTQHPPSGSPVASNKKPRIKSGASANDDVISEVPIDSIGNKRKDSPTHQPDSKSNFLHVQDMSTKVPLPNRNRIQGVRSTGNTPDMGHHLDGTPEDPDPSPRSNRGINVKATPDKEVTAQGVSSVLMKYYNKHAPSSQAHETKGFRGHGGGSNSNPQTSERMAAPTFFPVADLLPAVENNLRRRKRRGLGKQTSLMYRSHTMLDSNLWKKESTHPTQSCEPSQLTASYNDISSSLTTPGALLDEMARAGLKMDRKACGPPKFRPNVALSPLQRAKEIANRRIHGYLAKYPECHDSTRVSSPQNLLSKHERINSASRRLRITLDGPWK